MGYSMRGQIRTFWPDDNETEFYKHESATLAEIIEDAREKWGQDIQFEHIRVSSEYIHTDCLGYDRYDSIDYTEFLKIELRIPKD